MNKDFNGDRVRRYFEAYNTADRELMASLLADDFRFTSPYDDHIDRSTYFIRCWPQAGHFISHEIKNIVTQGDLSFVTYEGKGRSGATFRNTELFHFRGDLLQSVEVFFGLPPEEADQKDLAARGSEAYIFPKNAIENRFEKL